MLVWDIETNGLLDTASKIHCINVIDRASGKRLRFNAGKYADGSPSNADGTIEDALSLLSDQWADSIAGQNVIRFDIPVLKKLYPDWSPPAKVFDTRVASQVIWTNMADLDFSMLRSGRLPPEFQQKGLIGRHKLAAWGYRLGLHKGEFDPADSGHTWATVPFTKDMDDYCALDCEVTLKWIEAIEKKHYSQECLDLEHRVAEIIAQQERNGFCFDVKAAEKLYADLQRKRAALTDSLAALFPPWKAKDGKPFVPKRDNAKLGYKAGVAVQKYKTVVFNPASRDHIADRLIDKYGWKPEKFTDSGRPAVDESILGALKYPEAWQLAEFLLIEKRCGQLADGQQALLKCVQKDGRIHGSVNTNGAVTGRATHSNPNVAQVPRASSPYGEEFRSLFTTPANKVLVGCDASGLEARLLAHFLHRYDGGAFAKTVLEGNKDDGTDIHTLNMKAAGLATRDQAKTFFYGWMYGAGAAKIGQIVGKGPKAGAQLRARFLANMPALARLMSAVAKASKRGYLIGLDGRRLHIRSKHSALNTLLQSGGALAMKQALVFLDTTIQADQRLYGRVRLVGWIHDEWQAECDPDVAELAGQTMVRSIEQAGAHFKLRCPLTGEYHIGKSWAETH